VFNNSQIPSVAKQSFESTNLVNRGWQMYDRYKIDEGRNISQSRLSTKSFPVSHSAPLDAGICSKEIYYSFVHGNHIIVISTSQIL
jgi:hypothetical protein